MIGAEMSQEFAGKTAFVTGAASGIGLAVARRLAAGGAVLVLTDRDAQGGESVAADLTAEGARACFLPMDVTDEQSVSDAIRRAVADTGALHLAVNSAGVSGLVAAVAGYPVEEWRRVMAVNLDGVFHCLRHQIPAMLPTGGAIVNITSVLGTQGYAGSGAYVAAKHAVAGLTKTAALEYAARGVRINAVAPGFIDTPLLSALDTEQRQSLTAMHPAGRLGKADEVAELVAFLLSQRASYIHGSCQLVDGGYSAR
ncbi:SDR family NAD(P)-dependent oxidoreductase [Streptomyces sp. NPDC051555]|uniref:SDR family NAD(P)-dependent oxidoreductase n=1 Tax=Streptomyces sp. NPDC051555 TaxID=3365657 RepID=UPI0037931AD5